MTRQRVKNAMCGDNEYALASDAGELLRKKKLTLSVAESCTGGFLGSLITDVPESSDYFMGGIVCYANRIKSQTLGIPPGLIKKQGAVSVSVAKKMAENIRKKFETDLGIGVTGIAGPGGATKGKPIGLVYIAIASARGVKCHRHRILGSRPEFKLGAACRALKHLRMELLRKTV